MHFYFFDFVVYTKILVYELVEYFLFTQYANNMQYYVVCFLGTDK
jgi:hypothetical protein